MVDSKCMRGPPGDRHRVSGSSVSPFCLILSLAQGRYGNASLSPAPILPNWRLIGKSVQTRFTPSQGSGLAGCHIPEKSGLPPAVRGAGALRLGFPYGVRGTPPVG